MTLTVISSDRDQDNQSAIETLEAALREARAGRVSAVAIAIVRPNGHINTSSSATVRGPALLGCTILMQHRVLEKMEEAEEERE